MVSLIHKPQRGHPKRAELSDVNINTGVQSINTDRASLEGTLAKSSLYTCYSILAHILSINFLYCVDMSHA